MTNRKRITIKSLLSKKKKGEKIVCLTAYDYPTAKALDDAGVDLILVGDSAGMVMAGHESTLPITMDEMIFMTQWVTRADTNALVIGDMPFGSYQPDIATAIKNAVRFMTEGKADGVKLEGGKRAFKTVSALTDYGIPVFGHIGMTPQSVNQYGGYKVQGKTKSSKEELIEDALALQEAGAFAMVLEAMKTETARAVTEAVDIPTIGIGAGNVCDGQILVVHDLLGLFDGFKPTFVRRYAEVGKTIRKAVSAFSKDVRKGKFPSEDESY